MKTDFELYDYDTLILDSFIKIYCDKKMSLLIISGKPADDQLLTAWHQIIDEYNLNLVNFQFDELSFFERQKQALTLRYNAIQLLISRLLLQHDDMLLNELKELHYYWICNSINPDNKTEYLENLRAALSNSKRFVYDIEESEKQIKDIQRGRENKNVKIDKKYFARLLAILSKESHFVIERHKITVADFVEHIMLLKEKIERQENSKRA